MRYLGDFVGQPFFANLHAATSTGRTLTCNSSRSLVILSLVEYGFSVWPSTINSSLGLVLSLLVTLVSVYYVDADRNTGRAGDGEVVVPVEWSDVEGKGGKAE